MGGIESHGNFAFSMQAIFAVVKQEPSDAYPEREAEGDQDQDCDQQDCPPTNTLLLPHELYKSVFLIRIHSIGFRQMVLVGAPFRQPCRQKLNRVG